MSSGILRMKFIHRFLRHLINVCIRYPNAIATAATTSDPTASFELSLCACSLHPFSGGAIVEDRAAWDV